VENTDAGSQAGKAKFPCAAFTLLDQLTDTSRTAPRAALVVMAA
jgi:hypothetical protein